jgi:hypothetical protein
MEPTLKLALAEVQKTLTEEMQMQFADLDSKWEKRFLEDRIQREDHVLALENSLDKATSELDGWRPQVDSAVEDLKLKVSKMNKQLDRALMERSSDLGILDPPDPSKSATARPSTGFSADGPNGHRQDFSHRDHEFGTVFTQSHDLVKGTYRPRPFSVPPHASSTFGGHIEQKHNYSKTSQFGRLPKLHFPKFEHENPKLWISRCENYFAMYSVPLDKWVQVVVNFFEGAVARWLQSVEHKVYKSS